MTNIPKIHIRVFGSFQFTIGNSALSDASFRSRKALKLLKLLSIHTDYQIHRDKAMDYLWPDLDADAAAAQFYKAVHHIRKTVGSVLGGISADRVVVFGNETLSLNSEMGVESDIEEFLASAKEARRSQELQAYQYAIANYGGDVLPGDLYEPWAEEKRQTLRLEFLELLIETGKSYLEAGFLSNAAEAFRRAVAMDPLYETAHRELMKTFIRQGSRSQAIHQYRNCVDILSRELNTEPSRLTQQLYQDILRSEWIQEPVTEDWAYVGRSASIKPSIGRVRELKLLETMVANLSKGNGRVVLISGVIGIGKSRLIEEIIQSAQKRKRLVIAGTAYENEKEIPYGPFLESLRFFSSTFKEFAKLIPLEFARGVTGGEWTLPSSDAPDKLAAQRYLFETFWTFLMKVSEKTPLVVVIEDLHSADRATLELFLYLSQQVSAAPILLVGVYRESDSELPATLLEIARKKEVVHVELEPLSKEDHKDFLAQLLGRGVMDETLASDIFATTEGHPLFTKEIIEQLVAAKSLNLEGGVWRKAHDERLYLPPSLEILVAQKWNRLTPKAQSLLNVAAVAGQFIHLSIFEFVLAIPRESFLDLLDEIVGVGLLKESGLTYGFAHPLFRQIIYQQMSPARIRQIHHDVAQALASQYHDSTSAPVEAIAYHYMLSDDPGAAVEYLVKAGDRAKSMYALQDAIQRYREAIRILESSGRGTRFADILESLGDTYRALGDIENSLLEYKNAMTVLESQEKEHELLRVSNLHRKTAVAAILTLNMPLAETHLKALEKLPEGDPLEVARRLIVRALFHWHFNELHAAVGLARKALDIAEAHGAELEASQACEMLALTLFPLGQWQQGLEYETRRALRGWSPEIVVATDAHLCLWEYHVHGDEPYDNAHAFIEQVSDRASEIGDLRCVAVCHYALGSIAYLRGRYQESKDNLEQARNLLYRLRSPAGEAYSLARQAELETQRGNLERGWQLVQDGLQTAKSACMRDHCVQRLYAVALTNRAAAGDATAAEGVMQAAVSFEKNNMFCPSCGVGLLFSMAAFCLFKIDVNRAGYYAEKAKAFIDITQSLPGQAQLLRCLGHIHALQNEPHRALEYFAQSMEIFGRLGQKYDLVATLNLASRFYPHSEFDAQKDGLLQETELRLLTLS